MYATSCALALALLTNPPGTPLPAFPQQEWPAIRAAIVGLAVEWEILDEREERFARFEDLAADIEALRRRRRDLVNAPPLRDAQRFPSKQVAEERITFNRAFRRQLEQRRALGPGRGGLDEVIRETDQLFEVWDAVRDLRSEAYYVHVRRLAMARLRAQLGDAAYYAAQLPPHVPVWRFTEVK